MKTFLVLLLILSLFFYLTGCYSVSEMSKDEFKEKNKKGSATITTKNNVTYQFEKGWYHIDSDTLYGTGAKMHGEYKVPFSGKIALDDIDAIKVEAPNGFRTLTLILGVAAITCLVIYVVAIASISHRVIVD
jgi:hypothetical protein